MGTELSETKEMSLRELALSLLDDEFGISEKAYCSLAMFAQGKGIDDVLEKVRATEGRFYIPSED